METKTSNAQIEVWEWKERVYNEIKNLPESERISYILKKVKQTVELLKQQKAAA